MKLTYAVVIAAAILLGFLFLSYTVSLNGRYSFELVRGSSLSAKILDTQTGQFYTFVTDPTSEFSNIKRNSPGFPRWPLPFYAAPDGFAL